MGLRMGPELTVHYGPQALSSLYRGFAGEFVVMGVSGEPRSPEAGFGTRCM